MRPGLTEHSYSCRSESMQSQGSDGVGMKLTDVRSPAWRARAVARVEKKVLGFTRRSHAKSPVFIVGLQRSGTTMLMDIFHLHPETQVFDEARDSKVFLDFRIRGTDTLRRVIDDSHYEFPCFKIIADSHILPSIIDGLEDATRAVDVSRAGAKRGLAAGEVSGRYQRDPRRL